MEKIREQRAIFQKEKAQLFRDGKNTMTMTTIEKFKGHGGGAFSGIKIAAGWTKPTFAAKSNGFEFATVSTAI